MDTLLNRTQQSSEAGLLRTLDDYDIINRLLKRPLYKIPEHLRDKAVECISSTLDDQENSATLRLKAVQTLATLDKHNLDLVKMAVPKKVEHLDPKKLDDDELKNMVEEVLKLMPRVPE